VKAKAEAEQAEKDRLAAEEKAKADVFSSAASRLQKIKTQLEVKPE
jgi:hypothetical protein